MGVMDRFTRLANTFSVTVQLDTGNRKSTNKYWQDFSKRIFGVTYVEFKFRKKKKRSRKRIRKAFARFTTPIMKETHKQNK